MKWWEILFVSLTPVLLFAMIRAIVPLADMAYTIKLKKEERLMEEYKENRSELEYVTNRLQEAASTYAIDAKDIDYEYLNHIADVSGKFTTLTIADNSSKIVESYRPNRRLHCEYCGCISEKEHGTCEHCGAPLKEME